MGSPGRKWPVSSPLRLTWLSKLRYEESQRLLVFQRPLVVELIVGLALLNVIEDFKTTGCTLDHDAAYIHSMLFKLYGELTDDCPASCLSVADLAPKRTSFMPRVIESWGLHNESVLVEAERTRYLNRFLHRKTRFGGEQ